jgi:hypothetical protein
MSDTAFGEQELLEKERVSKYAQELTQGSFAAASLAWTRAMSESVTSRPAWVQAEACKLKVKTEQIKGRRMINERLSEQRPVNG